MPKGWHAANDLDQIQRDGGVKKALTMSQVARPSAHVLHRKERAVVHRSLACVRMMIMLRAIPVLLLFLILFAPGVSTAHARLDSGAIVGKAGLGTVHRSLAARGFYDFGPARWHRGVYRLTATEPRGQRVVVTVSARTGHILDMRVTHWTPAPARFGEVTVFQPVR
jgi:hypothetical protein